MLMYYGNVKLWEDPANISCSNPHFTLWLHKIAMVKKYLNFYRAQEEKLERTEIQPATPLPKICRCGSLFKSFQFHFDSCMIRKCGYSQGSVFAAMAKCSEFELSPTSSTNYWKTFDYSLKVRVNPGERFTTMSKNLAWRAFSDLLDFCLNVESYYERIKRHIPQHFIYDDYRLEDLLNVDSVQDGGPEEFRSTFIPFVFYKIVYAVKLFLSSNLFDKPVASGAA
jgi:hypothetical protein